MLQHLENVIESKIPWIQSLINSRVIELETELSHLGKPIAADAGVSVLNSSCSIQRMLGNSISNCIMCLQLHIWLAVLLFGAFHLLSEDSF